MNEICIWSPLAMEPLPFKTGSFECIIQRKRSPTMEQLTQPTLLPTPCNLKMQLSAPARRTPKAYAFSGVRPSSGAACSARAGLPKYGEASGVSDVAAPEDGRTPLNRYPKAFGEVALCLQAAVLILLSPAAARAQTNGSWIVTSGRSEERRVGRECK